MMRLMKKKESGCCSDMRNKNAYKMIQLIIALGIVKALSLVKTSRSVIGSFGREKNVSNSGSAEAFAKGSGIAFDVNFTVALASIKKVRANFLSPPIDWKSWAQLKTQYLFIHVGKAGGSTVLCKLCPDAREIYKERFTQRCKAVPFHPEKFGDWLHMAVSINQELAENYDTYITNLRNPITRFVSAFNYEKSIAHWWLPIKQGKEQPNFDKFNKCFRFYSIEKFLKEGLLLPSASNSTSLSPECQRKAIEFTQGKFKHSESHIAFNFEFYEKQFLFAFEYRHINRKTPARLISISTETMQEDFDNLDTLFRTGSLSETNNLSAIARPTQRQNVGKKVMNYASIPQTTYESLCFYLCQDIQAYKRLLYRSENLDDQRVLDRILDLNKFCPLEMMEIRNDCVKFQW